RAQVGADRFTHGLGHLRLHRVPGDLWGLPVRLEERYAVGTLRQMPPKPDLFVVGQRPLDVVQTEFDELMTADHGKRPVTPAVRWSIGRMVSPMIPQLALNQRNIAGRRTDEQACRPPESGRVVPLRGRATSPGPSACRPGRRRRGGR